MYKLFSVILSIIVLLAIFILKLNPVFALKSCDPIITAEPAGPLTNYSTKAWFSFNVRDTKSYKAWKIQFQCGVSHNKDDAKIDSANPGYVYRELDNSLLGNWVPGLYRCEFSKGPHTIQVFGVNDSGIDLPVCLSSYEVQDQDKFCNLTVDPKDKITHNSTVTVSGSNLIPRGKYSLYIDKDDNELSGPLSSIATPSFSKFNIPGKYLTDGDHTVYLRAHHTTFGLATYFPPIPGLVDSLSEQLCPFAFTVGTDTRPGRVIGSSQGVPSSAGGTTCDTDKDNPGIATAIGCIHTSPVGFVNDIFKFLIGISGGIAFLMMIIASFQMISSRGDPQSLEAARGRFTNALVGLLFIVFAVLLLQIIGVDILKLPGFGK